jgi:uncharacterized membrane protein
MTDQMIKSIIVQCDPNRAFAAWRALEEFPRRVKRVKSVTRTGEGSSRWIAEGPLGKDVEWTVETTTVEPGKRIAWNSRQSGDVTTTGQVSFNGLPGGQTEITVKMQITATAGVVADKVGKLFADPEKSLEEALANFKAELESARTRQGGAII